VGEGVKVSAVITGGKPALEGNERRKECGPDQNQQGKPEAGIMSTKKVFHVSAFAPLDFA